MQRTIHGHLIEALKNNTPEGENVVDTLIHIFPMSKEAAYRRLRGDIPFSLAEASRISERLYLSIDRLVGIDKKSIYMFHIKQLFSEDPFNKYYDLLQRCLSVYKQVKKDPGSYFYYACNTLPFGFFFKYQILSKYAFFKWFYQISYTFGKAKQLQDVVIPQKILEIQQEILELSMHVDTCFIFGDEIILSLINDIQYFTSIGLLNPNEVAELKQAILSMLNDMEVLTKNGVFKTGKKVLIFISNAFFDGSYSYMESTNLNIATIYLYGINQLNCSDSAICEHQKEWINSLIAHSTLISKSGKLQSTIFFNQQREILHTI